MHCTAGSLRSFTAIRKDAGLYCGSRLRKGVVSAYVGSSQNLKDLKYVKEEDKMMASSWQVLEDCAAVEGTIVTLNGSFCTQVKAWRIIELETGRALTAMLVKI